MYRFTGYRSTTLLSTTLLALSSALTLAACNAPETEAPQISAAAVDSPDQQRAEEAAYEHLNNKSAGLLDGVQAVWTTRVTLSDNGTGHTRVQQTHNNVPVFGGEAIVHTDARGQLAHFTDNFVRDIDVNSKPALSSFDATDLAADATVGWGRLSAEPQVDLQILRHNGRDYLTYRVQLKSIRAGETPSMPVVFIDAHTGDEVWRYDNLQTASLSDSDKRTYDMNNGTSYGSASIGDSSDSDLNMTHVSVGQTLAFLLAEVGRDSYTGTGTIVNSYGHYSNSYVNAFWDGSRLTFGDGDGSVSNYLGVLDVSAHELGHAVTTYTANLTYANESGALNEAGSDILAATVEAYVDGNVNTNTWNIGEDCWLQGGSNPYGNALRFMQAPSTDGSSRDHYSNRYTGSADNGGVHWNSGIANHWFYLLTAGGQHHNASYRSGCTISGIGISDAYKIWYHALDNGMNSSTNFAGARTATQNSCSALGYSSTVCDAVSEAWYEVGVGSDPGCGGGGGGPVCGNGVCEAGEDASSCPADCGTSGGGELSNGVPETGLSGSTGSEVFYTIDVPAGATNLSINISGGSGDADLYVKFGSAPTTSSYDCRPYLNGNNETCTFASPSAGTYHVMVRAYTSYSGVSLVASFDPPSGGTCTPSSGSANGLSGASGSETRYTWEVPACASEVTIKIAGGTGDADLYVQHGSAPTTTSYDCRPYRYGNDETCTFTPAETGTYHIMVRGYSAYSGVDLTASYE